MRPSDPFYSCISVGLATRYSKESFCNGCGWPSGSGEKAASRVGRPWLIREPLDRFYYGVHIWSEPKRATAAEWQHLCEPSEVMPPEIAVVICKDKYTWWHKTCKGNSKAFLSCWFKIVEHSHTSTDNTVFGCVVYLVWKEDLWLFFFCPWSYVV